MIALLCNRKVKKGLTNFIISIQVRAMVSDAVPMRDEQMFVPEFYLQCEPTDWLNSKQVYVY